MKFGKRKGIIAAGHPLTAEAGAIMFAQGGNAVDAAVAASFASCVTETMLTGLWGGGFALLHKADRRQNFLFDFFVNMPGLGKKSNPQKDLDFEGILADFKGALQEFHIGRGSVGVPGNILGLSLLHRRFGRLPFGEILAPAIRYARGGFPLTANQEFIAGILEPCLTHTPYIRKMFAPRGRLLREGEIYKAPDLVATLEALGKEGPGFFYRGEIGKALARFFKDGGLITQRDLEQYRVIIRRPLLISYRDETILMNPPPSLGGFLIRYSLRLLNQILLEKIPFGSMEFLKILVPVMKETNSMREKRERRKKPRNLLGNTTHISVLDEEENAVSLTTSHGSGAGFGIPGIGFPFNNMLGEQDLNPLGFHRHPPGRRFHSMMCPTITLKKGRPHIVLGSGGSNRLRSAILQVLIQLIDFKMSIRRAVASPRIHWEFGELNVEPGFSQKVMKELLAFEPKSLFWKNKNIYFGGVHAVGNDSTRRLFWEGAGDPRRGGVVRKVG